MMSRSKRLGGVANAAPYFLRHLIGGNSLPKFHLLQSLVHFLLVADVLANYCLIATDRRNEISSGPEMLPDEISLPLAVRPCQVNRTLSFDLSNYLRYRILRRNRQHHVHMIRHQMPLLNPAFLLLRQFLEHFPKMLSQFAVLRPSMARRDKHQVIFALPLRKT